MCFVFLNILKLPFYYTVVPLQLPKLINANFPTDPERMSIFGHSMGGHGALILALKNPGKYKVRYNAVSMVYTKAYTDFCKRKYNTMFCCSIKRANSFSCICSLIPSIRIWKIARNTTLDCEYQWKFFKNCTFLKLRKVQLLLDDATALIVVIFKCK